MKNNAVKSFGWMCFGLGLVLAMFYGFMAWYTHSNADTLATLTNFFVAYATFAAACTAVLLYNNWRDEKQYDLKKDVCMAIISNLHQLEVALDLPSRYHHLFQKLPNRIFIIPLKSYDVEIYDILMQMFQKVKLYSKIIKNENIVEEFRRLEAVTLHVNSDNNNFYENLYPPYFRAFLEVTEKKEEEFIRVKEYLPPFEHSDSLRIAIRKIERFYNEPSQFRYARQDQDIILSENKTYSEHLESYKEQLTTLIDKLSEELIFKNQ